MSRPRIVPSMIILMVIVYSFLMYSTVSGFKHWPNIFRRVIMTRKDATPMGDDFKVVYLAVVNFTMQKPVYFTVPGKHPNYDHIPQSLLLMYPFTLLPLKQAYYLFITFSFIAMFLLYLYAVFRLSPHSFFFHLLFFPCVVLFSQGGLLLLNRGNMGALSTVFIFVGFIGLVHRRPALVAISIALATCIKLAYAPLALLLLFGPKRLKLITIFGFIHVGVIAVVMLIHGSTGILQAYFVELGTALRWMSDWYGDANIGILSALSAYDPRNAKLLMTSSAGVILMLILLMPVLGVMHYRKTRFSMDVSDQLILYSLLMYITVLWPPISFSYQALILILIVPILDQLYRRGNTLMLKGFIIAEALSLGFVFTPDAPRYPLLGNKAPYYVIGFLLLAAIWFLRSTPTEAIKKENAI